MTRAFLFTLLFASCLLAACGGGSGGASFGGPATLDGGVTEIDGVTSGLGGVEFVLVETGQRVVTAADGTFEIPNAPAGSFTLALVGVGGGAAVDGAAAYAANCSVCHGADGSGPPNARGKTAAQFAAALNRGAMASITLTQAEYDAIFAFLGGVAPPAPPPPPPAEVDGAQVFADSCSICHGADGSGPPDARGKTDAQFAAALTRGAMASITLTTAEYDAVFAFLADSGTPPEPPPPVDGSDGALLYQASCAACHGDFDVAANAAGGNRQVLGARICTIEGSIRGTSVFPGGVPEMASLSSLTDVQISAIAEYLNSRPVTGQQRYVTNCAGCHGMTGSGGRTGEDVRGESGSETREAIGAESAMNYLSCLPSSDTDAIATWLRSGDDGDSGDDDADDDSDDDAEDDEGEDDHSDADDAEEIDDGDESSESEVCLHRVQSGERIRVRVRLREGRIDRCDVSREDHDEREVEVFLHATATADDADMTGRLELEERSDRMRIQVSVEHATPTRELEVVVIDAAGNEESLGVRAVNALGKAEWTLDSRAASTMPFGVGSLAELEGYGVEVRDASVGTALLQSTAPELPAAAPSGGGSGDEGNDDGAQGTRMRGRARLLVDEAGLEGHVEVRSRPEEGSERFQIEVEGLAGGRSVEFLVEDAGDPGMYLSVGAGAAGDDGEVELELDTGDGANLPGGVSAAADLIGLGVAVRDAATGALLLHGTVPPMGQD